MGEEQHKPWDQLPDEPIRSYRRFCIYLALGPARTIERAYAVWRDGKDQKAAKSGKRRHPGAWDQDASRFNWCDRAAAYDIAHVAEIGRNAVLAFVAALNEAVRQSLEFLLERERQPKTWKELMDGLDVLGDFIPAETVEAIQNLARSGGVPGLGAGPAGTISAEGQQPASARLDETTPAASGS